MIPAIVHTADVPTERVTGLHATVERSASLIGFGLAGALVAVVGPTGALVVDAASFGGSAVVLAATTSARHLTGATAAQDPVTGVTGFVEQLVEGGRFLRRDRVLVAITVMVSLTNMIDLAWTGVLTPVWGVHTGGGAGVVGALFAVFSGASALGAVAASWWATRLPRYATYLACFLLAGAPRFVMMAFSSPLWAVFGVMVLAGAASGFLNPILGAVIYERIPAHLTGRVTSLTTAACYALTPFGGLLGGILVGGVGLSVALLACGAAYLAVTMLPAVDPRWRDLDQRPVDALSGSRGR